VGALVVRGGEVIASAYNGPVGLKDPSAHAEILALRRAAAAEGNYRLAGTTLYVTIEPCLMCAGALIHARVSRLVFGASDPKGGASFPCTGCCRTAASITGLTSPVGSSGRHVAKF
jgi:tRNA(adenine34) deaminase